MDITNYEDFKTLGEYLKYVRKVLKVTTTELSQSADVSQPYLSLLENNKNTPSDEVVTKLARGFAIVKELSTNEEKEIKRNLEKANLYFYEKKLKKAFAEANKKMKYNHEIEQATETIKLDFVLNYFDNEKIIEDNFLKRDNGEYVSNVDRFHNYNITLDGDKLSNDEMRSLEMLLLGMKQQRKNKRANN